LLLKDLAAAAARHPYHNEVLADGKPFHLACRHADGPTGSIACRLPSIILELAGVFKRLRDDRRLTIVVCGQLLNIGHPSINAAIASTRQ
jgi:hypothetical protein